ncbi:ATP-binding protein [Jatrophihabitans fulvus]
MDPVSNPYTPGAGQSPAVLSGRDEELRQLDNTLARLERGRSAQCPLIVGLRGVGKTVLLNEFARRAISRHWVTVEHELTASGDLFATVSRLVREALLQVAPPSAWRSAAERVSRLLGAFEFSYSIAGLSVTRAGAADDQPRASMDKSRDMTDLLVALGEAAREHERGIALMFDELQFADSTALGALVTGLHKVAQRELPVTLVAAGLPQTRGVLAEAASYAERMFTPLEVGPLNPSDAARALSEPAGAEGVHFEAQALNEVFDFTEGYPFFLQVFGDHLWRNAADLPISSRDVTSVGPIVRDSLDRGFFVFRTDRLPIAQRRYLRAMAETRSSEVASGDVASILGMRSAAQAGTTRDALIRKGLIYSPRLGYAAFTVPQFDDYLRRHFELEMHEPRSRANRSG